MKFREDPRPLVAFDWSGKHLDVTFDGVTVRQVDRSEDLLPLLNVPHRIVCESTFESYKPERRAAMVELFRSKGHELYMYRPLATAKFRKTEGIEKTNTNDAQVIFRIAQETNMHLYPAIGRDEDWASRRAELNAEYHAIRSMGLKTELLIEPAKEILGSFKSLSPEDKAMFGNAALDKYSETLLAAVYFATRYTSNRHEFERLLGMSGSAHPSLLRSDVHHHVYRHMRKRRSVTMSEFRRSVRTLRARFLAEGVGMSAEIDGQEV